MKSTFLLFLALSLVAPAAFPATIYVDASILLPDADGSQAKPFRWISDALVLAVDDDSIQVAAGLYPESVRIKTKRVSLTCMAPACTIQVRAPYSGIEVSSDSTITGFTVEQLSDSFSYVTEEMGDVDVDSPLGVGLSATDRGRPIISDLTVTGFDVGLECIKTNVTVSFSTFSSNKQGIVIDRSHGASLIEANIIVQNSENGIISISSNEIIQNNTIAYNGNDAILFMAEPESEGGEMPMTAPESTPGAVDPVVEDLLAPLVLTRNILRNNSGAGVHIDSSVKCDSSQVPIIGADFISGSNVFKDNVLGSVINQCSSTDQVPGSE